MSVLPEHSTEAYQYEVLSTETSFRILELLPGKGDDPVACSLHFADLSEPSKTPSFEAISYAWGDPTLRTPIICHGKQVQVTPNLHSALTHFRYEDRSRFVWADALCINQLETADRNHQVRQMFSIYRAAKVVHIWLGPDNDKNEGKAATNSIRMISDFICRKLDLSVSDLKLKKDVYQEVVFKNRDVLPAPNEGDFDTADIWNALVWFYSHSYFTRVWAIQELNAKGERLVHCGHHQIEWERVELVAGYFIMDSSFSKKFGFSRAHCWWAAIATTERIRRPDNWLSMLYLTSNFSSTDSRDAIYGLLGLMSPGTAGPPILDPDYGKTTDEVYRDSVEAALAHFQNTDVLLYLTGTETPSWIPRWDKPMLFRNPFRFGKTPPWKPAGETKPKWSVDKESNVLSLSGLQLDTIAFAESYNEIYFCDSMAESENGRTELKQIWQRMLGTLKLAQLETPFSREVLTAVATAFSFGLNEKGDPVDELTLVRNFVAYLEISLSEEELQTYITSEALENSKEGDGRAFGKPVWDFKYPESSFFVTKGGLIGCSVSVSKPGDLVFAPLGSTYPLLLRPVDDGFTIVGYAYVNGVMRGERRDSPETICRIR